MLVPVSFALAMGTLIVMLCLVPFVVSQALGGPVQAQVLQQFVLAFQRICRRMVCPVRHRPPPIASSRIAAGKPEPFQGHGDGPRGGVGYSENP